MIRVNYIRKGWGLLFFSLLLTANVHAQSVENTFQTRSEVKLSYKAFDKIKFSLTPELRLDEKFSADKLLLEAGIGYKPIDILTLGANYRFVVNYRDVKETEYLHRYAFDATFAKSISRFKPSLRIRYTNYTEENANAEYLRYKAKLKYNIKDFKLSPLLAFEGFHDLGEANIYKMRYTLGAEYKLSKKSAVSAAYKLDYYLQEYQNKHILYVGYKYKF